MLAVIIIFSFLGFLTLPRVTLAAYFINAAGLGFIDGFFVIFIAFILDGLNYVIGRVTSEEATGNCKI